MGEVVSGLGEGAYYVRQYEPLIEEYLGFKPFPGTLNVKILFPKTVLDAVCNIRPVIILASSKMAGLLVMLRRIPL